MTESSTLLEKNAVEIAEYFSQGNLVYLHGCLSEQAKTKTDLASMTADFARCFGGIKLPFQLIDLVILESGNEAVAYYEPMGDTSDESVQVHLRIGGAMVIVEEIDWGLP